MIPNRLEFFKCSWRKESWNLFFALGILVGVIGLFIGGLFATYFLLPFIMAL